MITSEKKAERIRMAEAHVKADRLGEIAQALPVDTDSQPIFHAIHRDILTEVAAKAIGIGDEQWRVNCREAVADVAALHAKSATGGKVSENEWTAARTAARTARTAARAARTAEEEEAAAAWAWIKISKIVVRHLKEKVNG